MEVIWKAHFGASRAPLLVYRRAAGNGGINIQQPLDFYRNKSKTSALKSLWLQLDPLDFHIFLRFLYRSCRLIARAEQSKEIAWQMSTYAIELKSFGLSERKKI